MLQTIQQLVKKLTEKGQGIVEYALILGLAAVIAATLITNDNLKASVSTSVDNVGVQLDKVGST